MSEMTQADLERVLDGWCEGMIRDGWSIDSRAGLTASARRSRRAQGFAVGIAILVLFWVIGIGSGVYLIAVLGLAAPVLLTLASVDRKTAVVGPDGGVAVAKK